MIVDVKVPEVGESITEGVLVSWSVEEGDVVAVDDPLFELETDKITLTVQAQEGGKVQILVEAGEKVTVGQVVARLDTTAAGETVKAPGPERPAASARALEDELAPAVRRLVAEHGLDPAAITGTGKGGRVTKEDVVRFLSAASAEKSATGAAGQPAAAPTPAPPRRSSRRPGRRGQDLRRAGR